VAVVKTQSIEAFAAAIATAIPALAGKITVHQEVPATIEKYPNLAIILSSAMAFEPAQQLMHADLGNNTVVYNVGAFEGPIQLRIVATSRKERYALGAAIENWMLSREGSPGVQVVKVIDVDNPSTLSWVAAFEMDSELWDDSAAMTREYEAVATLNAVLPALVTRTPVYTIETLVLGVTSNFSTSFTPSTFGPPDVELVTINQDGTISPV
jgi:hypothetical protein